MCVLYMLCINALSFLFTDIDFHLVNKIAADYGGHATLMKAPENVRAIAPVFHPQPKVIAALTSRLKESFDPFGILNPGRMYLGT